VRRASLGLPASEASEHSESATQFKRDFGKRHTSWTTNRSASSLSITVKLPSLTFLASVSVSSLTYVSVNLITFRAGIASYAAMRSP
jgi:hypothetical protein